MAAESGGTKKPPKSTKATPKKPAKRTTAASRKPAKTAGAAPKPAKAAAAAKPGKRVTAAKAGKRVTAAKPANRASTKNASAAKPAARASGAAAKRAGTSRKTGAAATSKQTGAAPAAKPAPAPVARVAEVKATVAADASAKRAQVEAAARRYFDALAARDVDRAVSVWHEEGVDDVVPFGILRGTGAIRMFIAETFASMPDARFTVSRVIADETAAAVQWRLVGTFTGEPFQGLEPTGSRIDLRGVDNLEVEDGKIMHNTGVFDGVAYARQIGLLPPEDSGADRAIRAGFNTVTKLRRSVMKRTAG